MWKVRVPKRWRILEFESLNIEQCFTVPQVFYSKHHAAERSQVSFQIFPWCLKAKFQIPPLHSVMFVVYTMTPKKSISFQNFEWVFFVSNTTIFPNTTISWNFTFVYFMLAQCTMYLSKKRGKFKKAKSSTFATIQVFICFHTHLQVNNVQL